MSTESAQDYSMLPDGPSSADAPFNSAAFLHELAAAPDWQAFCEVLRSHLPRELSPARLDIYGRELDDTVSLRFSSVEVSAAPPLPAADSEAHIRNWLRQQDYNAIATMPLVGPSKPLGWLTVARKRGALAPRVIVLAERVAPLAALWLRILALEEQVDMTNILRARALLAMGTVHDIGNIFTTVLGHAQILEQDVPSLFLPDVRLIIGAVDDGRHLIGRLQNAEIDLTPDLPMTLQSIVEDTVKLTRPFWERHSPITVETVFEQNPIVHMSAVDLREVLTNLIMNAIAAMPSGGTLSIHCSSSGDRATVAVTDTGLGIAREYQSAIFQPLISTRGDGGGLGLSVSRAIVERYGGTLTVESAPSQGATFSITVPVQPNAISGK